MPQAKDLVSQLLSHVQLFVTPWIAACQASLSLTICWSSPKFMGVESVVPSNHLILCHPPLFAINVSQHQGPFQSHLSLKVSLCAVLSVSVLSDFCNPMDLSFTGKNTGVAISSFRGSSLPRNDTASPVSSALAERLFTTEPPGKPKVLHCHF